MKIIRTSLMVVFIFCIGGLLGQSKSSELIPTDKLKEDFTILKESLYKLHPDIHLYTSKVEFDSILNKVEVELNEPMLAIDLYRKLLPVIAAVRNNHTDLSPSQSYLDYMKDEAKRIPLSFYLKDDSLFVRRDASKDYIIKERSTIKKINGKNAISLLHEMAGLISTDGYNLSSPLNMVSKNFISYYSLFYGNPDSITIDYIDHQKNGRTINIAAITIDNILKNLKSRYSQYPPEEKSEYSMEMANKTTILKINTFQPEKEAKYYSFLKKSFKQIEDNQIKHLIIDVRDNRGGYPETANKLLSYLIKTQVSPVKISYALVDKIPVPNYFEKDNFYKHFERKRFVKKEGKFHIKGESKIIIKPQKKPYSGKLYILLNENSASATAEFLGLAYTHCSPIFIGRESGSNPVTQVATDIVTLTLPNSKITVRFPLIKSELNVNIENKGLGFIPDYKITPTIKELIENKDVALEKALQLIDKNKKENTNIYIK